MSNPPEGRSVVCPECSGEAVAIVPRGSSIVEREEDADGAVRVHCGNCGQRFVVHFRTDG